MEKVQGNQQRVNLQEIGLYLRIIQMDYQPTTRKEMAQLISEHFNLICLEEDIEQYEQLHQEQEDYEKLSKMVEFGNQEYLIE